MPLKKDDMVYLSGGKFLMGSNDFYPEERPLRWAEVEPFWIDRTPVTNAAFQDFVESTGYVTVAETPPDPSEFPGLDAEKLKPGSAVFSPPDAGKVIGTTSWWQYADGACWKHPEGCGSDILQRMNHPVVHVALADAEAYASWCGKLLPSEIQWEYASRGGLQGKAYAWGDFLCPGGKRMANYWRGNFPFDPASRESAVRTTAVGTYEPNGFGLVDMIGNVWEWTADSYSLSTSHRHQCCHSKGALHGPHVIKGGSFLCAENHCRRYRPAARHAQDPRTSTSHIGFRCIRRGCPTNNSRMQKGEIADRPAETFPAQPIGTVS